MKIIAEVKNVFMDESIRVSNSRLPVKIQLVICEAGNTHELTLCSSRALAGKLMDIINHEITVWT